jgi:diaminohydroxyphosphoribosylaminopyrimidine deaminase / 5-amino-6-(5-phosphoribosylamino)uracil reductase
VVNARDAFFMRQALQLAERGRGRTSPNPMVGALVVDPDGVIVGRGAHQAAGGPHAEVHALNDAGGRARGATLYCTLEPCVHQGRTGPCAPLVASAGVVRVVVATGDPNPVAAGGIALLRSRGLEVRTGVLEREAHRLNLPFFTTVRFGRPFVTAKVAVSLDGYVAAEGGRPLRLTAAAADRCVHRERAEVDAIAIGSGTMLSDDPALTARGACRTRPLTRVIFDRRLRTTGKARVLATREAGPVIIVTSERAPAVSVATLEGAGATVLSLEPEASLESALRRLCGLGITSMIVEGGPQMHRAFWDADLIDRVQIFVTDRVIGSRGTGWLESRVMSSERIGEHSATPVGPDVLLEGYVHRAH